MRWLLFPFLVLLLFFLPCSYVQRQRDVIIVKTRLTPSEVKSGQTAVYTLEFMNNFDKPLEVSVDFYDLTNIKEAEITCENRFNLGCKLILEPQEFKTVLLKLKTEAVGLKTKADLNFKVAYKFVTTKYYDFMVITHAQEMKDGKLKESKDEGPLTIKAELGFILKEKIGKRERILKDYALNGIPFPFKLILEDVGKPCEVCERALNEIGKGNIEVKLTNLNVLECPDFKLEGNVLKNIKPFDFKIKQALTCLLEPRVEQTPAWARIEIKINYVYEFKGSESLKILPG